MRSDRGKESSEKGERHCRWQRISTPSRRGISDGNGRLFHPAGRMRRRVSVVRCQIHLEYPPLPVSAVEKVIGRAAASGAPCAVITGGEPLMHPLVPLTEGLKANGLQVFLETSGTHPLQGEFDWICLSPKRQAPPLEEVFQAADELKVVIGNAEDLLWAEQCAARAGKEAAGSICSPNGAGSQRPSGSLRSM